MEAPYLKELESRRSAVAFGNRRLEAEYRTYVSHRSELNVRRQLALAAAIVAGVAVLDLTFLPREFAIQAAAIRFWLALLPIGVAFVLTHYRRALWPRQVAGVVVALGVGLTSLAIGDRATEADYPAFAGGYIIVVFAYFFLGLYYVNAVAVGLGLALTYVAIAVLTATQSTSILYATYNLLVLNAVCAFGAGQLELARRRDFLKERLLSYRATSDQLSGLANRRAFDARLEESWERARQTRAALALFLVDIDHFKAYNDHYGHQAGDLAIQRVGQAIRRSLQRPQDFASRYGGEEFAAIVPDVGEDDALHVAERIREAVLNENIEHAHSSTGDRVSVSIGVAHLLPWNSDRTPRGFVQIADEGLYAAKRQGRNRVVRAAASSAAATGMFALPIKAELPPGELSNSQAE
jgi:diguanylate cyclase (GGDEF)-like protein